MLTPKNLDVIFSVNFYQKVYKSLKFVTIADSIQQISFNDIIICSIINEFGQIQISIKMFELTLVLRYMKNSYILAKFITEDKDIKIFPRQIQFYFEYKVRLLEGNNQIHHLVLVK
ncbi:hypothetical protein C1646_767700 [Rhizophagus diaphanus]|nr:hypothetical protein C1646_767700 [Rhizophagus diaphanus] [Rhizophagus sp. MUCL 43196]